MNNQNNGCVSLFSQTLQLALNTVSEYKKLEGKLADVIANFGQQIDEYRTTVEELENGTLDLTLELQNKHTSMTQTINKLTFTYFEFSKKFDYLMQPEGTQIRVKEQLHQQQFQPKPVEQISPQITQRPTTSPIQSQPMQINQNPTEVEIPLRKIPQPTIPTNNNVYQPLEQVRIVSEQQPSVSQSNQILTPQFVPQSSYEPVEDIENDQSIRTKRFRFTVDSGQKTKQKKLIQIKDHKISKHKLKSSTNKIKQRQKSPPSVKQVKRKRTITYGRLKNFLFETLDYGLSEIHSCFFCGLAKQPQLGDVYKIPYKDDSIYSHDVCAIWSTKLYLENKRNVFQKESIEEVISKCVYKHCYVCGKPRATLHCNQDNCRYCYHFSCFMLQNSGRTFEDEDRQFEILCEMHDNILRREEEGIELVKMEARNLRLQQEFENNRRHEENYQKFHSMLQLVNQPVKQHFPSLEQSRGDNQLVNQLALVPDQIKDEAS